MKFYYDIYIYLLYIYTCIGIGKRNKKWEIVCFLIFLFLALLSNQVLII